MPAISSRDIEALRERISTLSAAILRISTALDPDTVLAEVVESARGLTGARYGVIVTVDETGAPADFVLLRRHARRTTGVARPSPVGSRLFPHARGRPQRGSSRRPRISLQSPPQPEPRIPRASSRLNGSDRGNRSAKLAASRLVAKRYRFRICRAGVVVDVHVGE